MNNFSKEILSRLKGLRKNQPIPIAHRGASAWANENTLRAFRIANKLCSQMWELDVQLTKDKICVVCHDDNLLRLTGYDLNIFECNWDDLKNIPLKKGGHLTTLREVIILCKELNSWLYIEVKGKGAGIAALNELRNYNFQNALLGSFEIDYLIELRENNCEYPLSILLPFGKEPIDLAGSVGVDIIHLCWEKAHPKPQQLIKPELLKDAKNSGLEVILWHEERPEILNELLVLPVLGICSDKPELLTPLPKIEDHKLKIVCHRGAETFTPENSMSSIELAFNQGFEVVEIDVRDTSDGIPMVIHDSRVNRTTNSGGQFNKMTYKQINQLDAGSWFDPFFSNEKIPKLEDVLNFAKGRGQVYIEIKKANPESIVRLIEKAEMLKETFLWCEDESVMDKLRFINNNIRLMSRRYDFDSIKATIERHNPYLVEFNGLNFSKEDIDFCHKNGVLTMSFTMSSNPNTIKKLSESGFDFLNLSHPEIFKIISLSREY